MADRDDELFWELAEPLMAAGAEKSTMMGFPCLRINGNFFACTDKDSGDLIVKLDASRVASLVGEGIGLEFAPAGRTFREWVQVPERNEALWDDLLAEAMAFVAD